MSPRECARALLKGGPADALCNACLALACSASLQDMARITDALTRESGDFATRVGTCSSCRRTTMTAKYVAPLKCAHCSLQIENKATGGGLGLIIDGDQFHRTCWQLLICNNRIRISRSLSRQSRELIAQARRRLDGDAPEE